MSKSTALNPISIERHIHLIRGQKVMLDTELAALYGVITKALNQAVSRNAERFPSDFMFQLTEDELANLRSQFVTSSSHGGRRTPPYAFTEQGVAMLSSVLRSPRAIAVNIQIMRAFVAVRHLLATNQDLAKRINELEKKTDGQFRAVFDAIRQLMQPPAEPPKPRIGFHTESAAPKKPTKAPAARTRRTASR